MEKYRLPDIDTQPKYDKFAERFFSVFSRKDRDYALFIERPFPDGIDVQVQIADTFDDKLKLSYLVQEFGYVLIN